MPEIDDILPQSAHDDLLYSPARGYDHEDTREGDAMTSNPAVQGEQILPAAGTFVQRYIWRILILSALVVIPCLWHPRIEAGDLGSHVYNAWLVQLIERGQAPGLYLATKWNNVLFDLAIGWTSK
jgi:hypothetical protein